MPTLGTYGLVTNSALVQSNLWLLSDYGELEHLRGVVERDSVTSVFLPFVL